MDAALETIKTNPDPAARKAAAEDVNRIFGEQVYNWWSTWTLWGIIEQPYVNGVESDVAARRRAGQRSGRRRSPQHQPVVVRRRGLE